MNEKIVISKLNVTEGIRLINDDLVVYVIEFLKTKQFRNKNASSYMFAFSISTQFSENNGKEMFEYFIRTIKIFLS